MAQCAEVGEQGRIRNLEEVNERLQDEIIILKNQKAQLEGTCADL